MSIESSAATSTSVDRTIDTPEFIRRLAEDQRIKSGSDLPLSCFIEQVKMQLKGRPAAEAARMTPDRLTRRSAARPAYQTSELFQAWAMPEQAGGMKSVQ
jgi:hypothetical protein